MIWFFELIAVKRKRRILFLARIHFLIPLKNKWADFDKWCVVEFILMARVLLDIYYMVLGYAIKFSYCFLHIFYKFLYNSYTIYLYNLYKSDFFYLGFMKTRWTNKKFSRFTPRSRIVYEYIYILLYLTLRWYSGARTTSTHDIFYISFSF